MNSWDYIALWRDGHTGHAQRTVGTVAAVNEDDAVEAANALLPADATVLVITATARLPR